MKYHYLAIFRVFGHIWVFWQYPGSRDMTNPVDMPICAIVVLRLLCYKGILGVYGYGIYAILPILAYMLRS